MAEKVHENSKKKPDEACIPAASLRVSIGSMRQRIGQFRVAAAILVVGVAASGCMLRPEPFAPGIVGSTAQQRLDRVFARQEPVSREVSLYEAMARALKYNLEHKVQVAESAVRARQLEVAHYSLLPNLVAKSGYSLRDSYSGGRSREILGRRSLGAESLRSSTSQERDVLSSDLSFSWSVLDFGLSYVRAKQSANEVLIARELRRKMAAKIIEDVRTTYWRALTNQRMFTKLRELQRKVKNALASSRIISSGEKISPIAALTYERELLEIKRELERLQGELVSVKSELAVQMNERPDALFRLAEPGRSQPLPKFKMGLGEMLANALARRAEIRELYYKARINRHEIDAAILELLPGLQLFADGNFSSNKFLYANHWLGWGAKASWNLMKVFQYPAKKTLIRAQDKLLRQKALAMSMAIYLQVHASRARYLHAQTELQTAREFSNVQKKLLRQVRVGRAAGSVDEQSLIREEMNTLIAQVKHDIAYANLQNSYANLYTTIGLEAYPSEVGGTASIDQLTQALRSMWMERGELGLRPTGI